MALRDYCFKCRENAGGGFIRVVEMNDIDPITHYVTYNEITSTRTVLVEKEYYTHLGITGFYRQVAFKIYCKKGMDKNKIWTPIG